MIREPSDLSSISTTSSDYQAVKTSNCPRWLKIVSSILGVLVVLTIIIIPTTMVVMKNNRSDYEKCFDDEIDSLNNCLTNCAHQLTCYDQCYEHFHDRMENCIYYEIQSTTTTTELIPTSEGQTTPEPISDPSDVYIYVFPGRLNSQALYSGDGEYRSRALDVTIPFNDFGQGSKSAMLNGEVYVFGGYTLRNMIARLDGCDFMRLLVELDYDYRENHAVLSIDDGSRVLICFGSGYLEFEDEYNNIDREYIDNVCEIFDGENTTTTNSVYFNHEGGDLGFYQNQPTAYGSRWTTEPYAKKVETMNDDGWFNLTEHSLNIYRNQLVGLASGAMLSIGGEYNLNNEGPWLTAPVMDVWMLKDNSWATIGKLRSPVTNGANLFIDSRIYIFGYSNDNGDYSFQRLDMEGDEIMNREDFGYAVCCDHYILYQTTKDFCFDPHYSNNG